MREEEFEYLRRYEAHYENSLESKRKLARKVLTMVVAPTGAGKSTVIRQAVAFQAAQTVATWGEPGSLVTRERHPDDPPSYRTANEGITRDNLARRAIARTLTNYSIHESGAMYATAPENFAFDYNLLPTLPSSVPALTRAGFESTRTVFLTVEPHDLKAGLAAREADPSFQSRIKESIGNVEYALDNADRLTFIRNSHLPGGKEIAADDLIAVSLDNYYSDDRTEIAVAESMRAHLLTYLEA